MDLNEHQKMLTKLMAMDRSQLSGAFLAAIESLFNGDEKKIHTYINSITEAARQQNN